MNREEAAKAMFDMKNALKLPYDGLVKLADQMNYLGNKTGAGTASIVDFVNRVGSIGEVAGFSADKVAAIGASLIEQGMAAEVAATGAKKIFVAMAKGEAATKSEAEMYAKLGIDPIKLAKLAQKDAEKAFFKVFNAIKNKREDERTGILTLLFGREGLEASSKLFNSLDKLHENLEKVKGSEYKGSVDSEADIKRATTENQIEILKGKASIAFSQLGNLLLPEVNEILNSFSNLLSKITEFQELHPEGFKQFMKWIGYGSIAMLGFGAVLKPVSWGIKTYSKYMEVAGFMTEHKFGTKLFSVGKKLITGVGKGVKAIKGFGATLLGNPLTWYIAGILAIVAAGYLLYKNWDTVKQGAIDLKNKVVELVDKYWFMLGPLGALVKGGIEVYRNWDTIKEKAGELKDNIANMVTNIILKWDSFKASTQEILGDVFSWIEGKWNSIKSTGAGVLEFYLGIFSKLQEKFDWIVNKGKSLLGIGEEPKYSPPGRSLPRYAAGGIVSNPTIAWVGEGGYSESIIPHDRSNRSLNLWEKTGQMIGAYDRSQQNSFQLVYSPVIQARDLQGVQQELKHSKEEAFREFKSMMIEYEREQRRRGYGR
ncbi:phage tail tape measure protein, TP901 family, core region [Fusobacterium necrophorum subsp. funduliforme 1_1_36S]|nr:phage tail tape measure protein, TP901 family, core region [Fusobacterium necrophorum subsp. funduliforme 1_1_36S]